MSETHLFKKTIILYSACCAETRSILCRRESTPEQSEEKAYEKALSEGFILDDFGNWWCAEHGAKEP